METHQLTCAWQGVWSLLYSSKSVWNPSAPLGARVDGSRPGLEALFPGAVGAPAASSSPIQRAVTGNEFFAVSQEIVLASSNPRVDTVVRIGDIGELRLCASASTAPENRRRIDFLFTDGGFQFKSIPFRIPYPVPFSLLGDEARGWLDTTFMSGAGQWRLPNPQGNLSPMGSQPVSFHSAPSRQ